MPGGAGQLSSGGGGQGRGAGAIAAEPSWVAERPRRRDPGEVGPPRGARRVRGVRTPARPVVALSASSGPPWDVRPTGRADVQCPRVRCPGVRCPGVRGIQVSGRTGSGIRGAAAALSAPWTPEWLGVADRPGRAQRVDVPRGLWAAWSPACIGPDGKGMVRRWPWLARMRSTVARAAAWPAFRLRRRLGPSGPTRALVQGQGAGPDGGGARDRAGVHRPRRASWAGRRRGADQGAWTKGGDHAEWSLGERWSGGGELRRAHPFGGGSSLRPRRGRSA
jgi:hypothetical protein